MFVMLLACGAADPETLVDELRVLVIQSEPAELRLPEFPELAEEMGNSIPPQNPFPPENAQDEGKLESDNVESGPHLNIVVLDPATEGVEVAVWVCTNFGDGCLEKELYQNPAEWVQYHQLSEPEFTLPIPLSPFWLSFLQQPIEEGGFFSGSLVWVLACAPNVCNIIHDLKEGSVDVKAYGDPFTILEKLPAKQTSLAFRSLNLSSSTSAVRLENPQISPIFEDISVLPGESQFLDFDVNLAQRGSEAIIYGYTTIGGFGSNYLANNAIDFESGTTTLQWFTEDHDSGDAQLISFIDDGLGGINYWIGLGTVQK